MNRTPLESWIHRRIGCGTLPLTREQIERHQLMKLRETVHRARTRSPFYGKHLKDFGSHRLARLKDLANLPFTDSDDIRRDPSRFLCVSQGEINRVVTIPTSGTTGEPKRIYFTREDQELTIDFFHHGMSTLVGPGARVLILMPAERPGSVGDLLAAGLDRLGAVGVVYGPVKDYPHALDVMAKERIDAVVGVPVQVLSLARHGSGKGRPASVLLSADYVPDSVTEELRRIWQCEVFTHYGMTEMGFGGGVECEARFGYHLREADMYFEIIDPKTGIPVEKGELGEVVFTTLTRRGMPLIRYRTGDLSRFIPQKCPCGTVLETMAQVRGRIDGRIELEPGKALAMADLDEAVFRIRDVVDFSAEITGENGIDCLRITVTVPAGDVMRTKDDVSRALNGIPVVRSAVERGTLAVFAAVRQGSPGPLNSSVKRTLTDKRN